MIQVTRLNKVPFVVNSDLIKFIEQAPDTVITLFGGEKIVVRETPEELIERVVAYRGRLLGEMGLTGLLGLSEVGRVVKGASEDSG